MLIQTPESRLCKHFVFVLHSLWVCRPCNSFAKHTSCLQNKSIYLKHPLESGSVWQLTGNFVQQVIKVVGDGSDGRVDGGVGGTEGGGQDGDGLSGPRRDRW